MSQTQKPFKRIPVASSPEQRFNDYLQSRGMRNTKQRRDLMNFVFEQHEHFDADQLIERLPPKGKSGHVSRPTVYRTLSELVDAGLLRKFELGGRAVYEYDYGYPQHDHLFCQQCESLIEFQSDELLKLRTQVAEARQFTVTGHRLIITGVCESCKKRRSRTKRRVDMI